MSDNRKLKLSFHGKIIDHLGIQMYQSPIASIAELISNAWDADATEVNIQLPTDMSIDPKIIIQDNGIGMTFDECQNKYLNVGYNKREASGKSSTDNGRPLMGRKGIGKFAGFGIAKNIKIETVSKETGERTVFNLDLETIRKGDTYVNTDPLEMDVEEYNEPDPNRVNEHGMIITLSNLTFDRAPSIEVFKRGISRRFTFNSRKDDFIIKINGIEVEQDYDSANIEFSFPRDYTLEEKPENIRIEEGFAVENISDSHQIRWEINFYKDTIQEQGVQGIAVYAHKKLAQSPFMFNLTGGLPSQTGPEYMSGIVIANFVDELPEDVISPERQRLNWSHRDLKLLEQWGQEKIKELLKLWKKRRQEEREKLIEEKIEGFGSRLGRFPPHEREVIKKALKKLAELPKLDETQFIDMGEAILTSWEGGRLKALIEKMAGVRDMTEKQLLNILLEANVLTALHTAEAVKTKLDAIHGLRERIEKRELENAVRDYIAKNPWLISPKWETFIVERSLNHIMRQALQISEIENLDDWRGRVDLILSSGESLLVLEFMRPGLKIDRDHLSRFEDYINSIRASLESQTGLHFKSEQVYGYLIADRIDDTNPALRKRIEQDEKEKMYTLEWGTLLSQAESQWKEFLDVLIDRSPEDERLQTFKTK